MKKNSFLKRILSSILALVMVLGAFTALDGIFSGAKAETVNADGSITYGASDSSIVLNKDAWLQADGTYAIDLTAFVTGEKQLTSEQFEAPTDFIVVVDQSCTMRNYWSYGSNCYGSTYTFYTYKLAAAKSIARALVDELRSQTHNGVDHRVGIIGFGGYSCDSSNSNTGLFDTNGNWYNYRFSFGYQWPVAAQNKYNSNLVHVNTTAGYNALTKAVNALTYSSGAYADAGLEMAKGVINATRNDTYQVVNQDGTTSNVARKKVVIMITDGTPGWDGFDMQIGANAVNIATSIKKDFGAKIYTVALSTELEEFTNTYDMYGSSNFAASYTWTADAVPVHRNSFNPTYGTNNGLYTTQKYNTLRFNNEEFFARDFTTVISSVYPCTENYGANGSIEGKYITNAQAYSYVGQSAGSVNTNYYPMYYSNGQYATYVTRSKSIGYFYTESNGSHKLISGLYDCNVRNFNNRIAYNNHPIDKAADPAYSKYRISVPNAQVLVNGHYNSPNYNVPTQALTNMVATFVSEIPAATNFSGAGDMTTIGDAYIKDIISEYFKYHTDFDVNTNVKTFTQDAIGFENGEYVFASSIVPYNGSIVTFDGNDVVCVGGFDYDANTCYRDANGVHGKKFIVQIRGLLAKPTTVGNVPVSNTPGNVSGLYSGTPSVGGGNDSTVVNNFKPITDINLESTYLAVGYNSVSSKQPVLNVYPENSDYTVSWSIADTSVATVDSATGRLTPKSSAQNRSTTLTVNVHDNVSGQNFTDSAMVTVVGMTTCTSINYCELGDVIVKVGSSKMINFDVSPINTYYQVTWTGNSNQSAVSLEASGKVTGLSEGTSVLTAKITDQTNNKVIYRNVTVTVLPETNGGSTVNGGSTNNDQIIVKDGDEVVFPVPYVNLREKHIVYDFSLVIKD
ncbi:MAG: VWA domain-containing protein, partial [Clostridia bacterium]|nr:VWA domain-containing protein [Clostridia bacterium]